MQRVAADQDSQKSLFLSVTEQLQTPLMQLARLSELAAMDPANAPHYLELIRVIADASLQLAESYALSLRVQGKVAPLQLEPIAVSALLYDAAERLAPFAKQYGVEIAIDAGPRQYPVIGDRAVLAAALTSLGQVFVLAQSEADTPGLVHLGAHKGRYGVVAGVYGQQPVDAAALRRARALHGAAAQPLHQLVGGLSSGVFVADSLLGTLASKLHVAKYHNLTGLAATLTPSSQLQIV